jgi:hypothetical protein
MHINGYHNEAHPSYPELVLQRLVMRENFKFNYTVL